MTRQRTDLGEASDFSAVAELLPVAGLKVVDVGCGAGATSRELAAMGAEVLGVEPDPVQAAKNRAAAPVPGLSFAEGGAESLPLEADSVDAVFFFRSLHHVPMAHMGDALTEAARVLKPGTGTLCIVEPGMDGSHFAMMRPFHDETEVRTEAQRVLGEVTPGLFEDGGHYRYVQYPRHPDFGTMVERFMGMTFNSIAREQIESDEVRALFEQGRQDDGEYVFEQPMLLDLYRKPAAA